MPSVNRGEVERWGSVSYYRSANAEGSHNGIAAVLKTAARKGLQVRVLSPPPLLALEKREILSDS